MRSTALLTLGVFSALSLVVACGDDEASDSGAGGSGTASGPTSGAGAGSEGGSVDVPNPLENPEDGPPAGNPNDEATCEIPAAAGLADVSSPRTVVGTGTAASCTGAAVVDAVAAGGVVTFDCGPDPITITLDATAKIFNDTGPDIVIDGGGLVTLSGNNQRRILYMNTCDEAQHYTTDHCDDQDHPRLTLQNITFLGGDSRGETEYDGGAIYNDGNTMTLSLCGTRIEANEVVQHGSAIFFVTNDHTGNIRLDRTVITGNTGGSWYALMPGISCHDDTPIEVIDSVVE